jgi:hypothetical protein
VAGSPIGASQATATVLGTVYAKQTTGGGTPYLTAFGYNAGVSTTGASNTAIGTQALFNNGSGYENTAVGYQTLYTNSLSTGVSLTAIGMQAGYSYNSSGSNQGQVYVGVRAGYYNVSGIDNTYVGGYAGYQMTSSYNTAIGSGALLGSGTPANNTGTFNTAVGYQTLFTNTSGGANTAIGHLALAANTTGTYNTAVGWQTLLRATTGQYNIVVGETALANVTSGSFNTAIGPLCGNNMTTGSYNCLMGWTAAYGGVGLTTGSNNTLLGTYASPYIGTDSYELVVSAVSTGAANIGRGQNTGFIVTYDGSSYGGIYQGNNSSSWTTTSDRRLKKNIVDNTIGLDAINAIQVRNFEYRTEDEITELDSKNAIKITGVQIGAIAQELQQVLPDCVKTETTGVMSVDTTNITWHLINAVKELSAELNALKAKVGA